MTSIKNKTSTVDFIQTRPGIFLKVEKAGQGSEEGFKAYLEGFFYKYYELSDSFINKIYTRKDIHTSIWHQLAAELKKEDSTFNPDTDYLIIKTDDKNLKKILKIR